MEESEIVAAESFKTYFNGKYGNEDINFHVCTLADAITNTCHVAIESRKILGLYLHNNSDPFSTEFCNSIQDEEIKEILGRSYYLIGWNVSEIRFHNSLVQSLACLDSTPLESIVTCGRASFIIIFSIQNEVCMYSRIHATTTNILLTLSEAEKSFKSNNNIEMLSNQVSSSGFQHRMCIQLHDRDYDKFEVNQHELLKQKIGYTKFGPPTQESGYNEKQQKEIDVTYEKICKYNNLYAEYYDQVVLRVIFNCLEPLPNDKLSKAKNDCNYNPDTDFLPVPVFVIRKCMSVPDSCRIIIDSDNRIYDSWESYIKNNKHHPCCMILPKNGRYKQDSDGHVALETHMSPSCSIIAKVINGIDIGMGITSISSAAVIVAAAIPAITVLPVAVGAACVTGAGASIYSMVRSGCQLYNRNKYGESMDIRSSNARAAYLNIAAGSLGFIGFGVTSGLSQLATKGFTISKGAQLTVDGINICNLTVSGLNLGNSIYETASIWVEEQQTPSALTVLQLASSILFFAHATTNFKSAETITYESQLNTLRKYQQSLNSNKYRKMFNKLLKETVRQNNGNTNTAYAEVISASRAVPDQNTIFSVLQRNNKLLNKNGIRFFVKNGQVQLNGIPIDLIEFGSMSPTQKLDFLSTMPETPTPITLSNATNSGIALPLNSSTICETLVVAAKYGSLISNGCQLSEFVRELLKDYSNVIQHKIFMLLRNGLDDLLQYFPKINLIFEQLDSLSQSINQCEPIKIILQLLIKYIRKIARQHQMSGSCIKIIEETVTFICSTEPIKEKFLRMFVEYVVNHLTERILEFLSENEAANNRGDRGRATPCNYCRGNYFIR